MSQESSIKKNREKFEKRMEEMGKEHEALEQQIRRDMEAKLARSELEFRKEFALAVREVLGQEDWLLLTKWLARNREKEVEGAKNLT